MFRFRVGGGVMTNRMLMRRARGTEAKKLRRHRVRTLAY